MMRGKFIWLFVILISGIVSAQDSIQGKIYGDSTIARYIKVSNTLKNTTTFSDENGNFSLKASVGDSILFSSSFYEKKKIIIDNSHFSEIFVIQLKDKINQLDEVLIKENLSEKEFNIQTHQKELNTLLKNDRKSKPWEHDFPVLEGQGINLKGFKYLKERYFPKKEENSIRYINLEPISYDDLKNLNNNDEFFSDTFFIEDLKIPQDFKYIFFEYFDDQKISSKLLNSEKRMLLIEKFFEVSDKFLNRVNQVKAPVKKATNDSIKSNTHLY